MQVPNIIGENIIKREWLTWLAVFVGLCLCTAFADFSTKGEPREALVAVDMLKSGNWILPVDASGDMSYKPPMFHWLIVMFSLPFGHVSEFTSRLPSVLALTLLLMLTAKFCAREYGKGFGVLCAMFALTSFEMMRSGTIARVDMVLTLFMVGAMYALFYSAKSACRVGLWCLSVICMSAGVLTKGPVAILLPLATYWLWRMIGSGNFFKETALCVALALVSLIIPGIWYYAAWRQGGDGFLTLAMEENFGRFTGTMSYDSHVKPIWYNFTSLLIGLLPWSALALATLFSSKVRKSVSQLRHIKQRWSNMSAEARYAFVSAVLIFVFYCIPKSKRSVYLLPMYPFMAYAMGSYAVWLTRNSVIGKHIIQRLLIVVMCLYAVGIGIVFPIYGKVESDKYKARQIERIVPADKKIYTFIPDRFVRFYILNFYLDGRLVSSLPSGQTQKLDKLNAAMMRLPDEREFYLLTTQEIYKGKGADNYGLNDRLNAEEFKVTLVYESAYRTHDIKGKPIILKIQRTRE
ncbi:MAG: glycosyltransferase family 39 protein [Prevotella sp.]|nr:glycosyltransferase family 39 protein [Prevotella sp.]MCM1075264.1 glycosyltransferase family 39 protein [Ruminococcus sp.]